jgi:hypothetical protein
VVFAFWSLGEARVDKDPWAGCYQYGFASCALRERLCSWLCESTIIDDELKPRSRRSAIVRLLLLLRVHRCIAHCTPKIGSTAPRFRHEVQYIPENVPTKFGDTGTSVAKDIRDTILTYNGSAKVLCMLTTRWIEH